MGEIVNLRRQRKRKLRDEAQAVAAENRERFGETKQVRQTRLLEVDRLDAQLDAHRLERSRGPHERS